jgi:hypothetical protein
MLRRPVISSCTRLTRFYSEQPVNTANTTDTTGFIDVKFFKRGRKYRDEQDPKKLVDPKVLEKAKLLSWKALGIATTINIALAIITVFTFRNYLGIRSIPELQQWLRNKLNLPDKPTTSKEGSEKLRKFFGLHDSHENDHDFGKR